MTDEVMAWVFQGGRRVTKTISATAGNVVTNLSPGANKRWIVLYGRINLTTDATVADRYIVLSIRDSSGNVLAGLARNDTAITASSSGTLDISTARLLSGADTAGVPTVGIGTFVIDQTDVLRIAISSGQAGDSYSGYVVVLEIEE